MAGTILSAALPLTFPSVLVKESNEVAGQLNTLTLTTSLPVPLLPGSNITVSSPGLTPPSFDGASSIPVTLTHNGEATTLTARLVNGTLVPKP